MTYTFLQAKYFTPGGMIQPRAVVVHMAEGYGTASWLTHPTNNNSSHFVVEKTGHIIQMVKDADASHSLHVAFDADLNDAPDFGIFSPQAAAKVLGPDGYLNPNAYIFAIEVEGYAAYGPTDIQTAALAALIRDLRERHPSLRGNLGHRDFQDYKACPGGKVDWRALGGHGLYPVTTPVPEPEMTTTITVLPFGGKFTIPAGKAVTGFEFDPATGVVGAKKEWLARATPSGGAHDATVVTTATRGGPFLRCKGGFFDGFLIAASAVTDVVATPVPADTTPFTQADLDAAKASAASSAVAAFKAKVATLS